LFLRECLESVFAQSRVPEEVIVVDDGSTDAHTLGVLDDLESDHRVTVLRGPNRGPGAARNRAIRHSSGAAVLPLDADNWLEPEAIEVLVGELQSAPPEVGWIYQNLQFHGSRTDFAVQPVFNAYLLLQRNYCDTCALIDRRMLDAGVAYREEILLGHEDWDFYLQALQKGFIGHLCHRRLLHVRKHGFTRSDAVTHRFGSFVPEVTRLNPELFAPERVAALKRRWCPAMSIVLPGSGPAADLGRRDVERLLEAQTCQDFEVIDGKDDVQPSTGGPLTHGSLTTALGRAKGKYLLVWTASGPGPLGDPAFIEKGLRLLENANAVNAVVLVPRCASEAAADWVLTGTGGLQPTFPPVLGLLVRSASLAAASQWHLVGDDEDAVGAIVAVLDAYAPDSVEWRSFRTAAEVATAVVGELPPVVRTKPHEEATGPLPEEDRLAEQATEIERACRMTQAALWPVSQTASRGPVGRPRTDDTLDRPTDWQPRSTHLLWLATEAVNGECHLVAEGAEPALTGLVSKSIVGRVYAQQFPGTSPLFRVTDWTRHQSSVCFSRACRHDPSSDVSLLGYFSTAPLPGMINLLSTVHQQLRTSRTLAGAGVLRTHCEGWSAFVEPESLPPLGIDAVLGSDGASGEEAWPIYTLSESRYTLHPDEPVTLGGWVDSGGGRLGSVFAVPGRYKRPLHRFSQSGTGRILYASTADEGRELGYAREGALGHLLTVPLPGTTPLYRFHSPSVGNHRLSVDPSGRDPGWHLDGYLGHVLAPSNDRPLLRRWRHRTDPAWRYTSDLGTPASPGDDWVFETTLGFGWATGVRTPVLVPFVELRHPGSGRFAYSVNPEEFERLGYRRQQVVCSLLGAAAPGTVAIRRSFSSNAEAHVYGLASQELASEGFAPEGACAFAHPAVPARRVLTGEADLAQAHAPLVAGESVGSGALSLRPGASPGASPVFRFTRHDAETWFGTDHAAATSAGYQLDDVVGYLVDRSATFGNGAAVDSTSGEARRAGSPIRLSIPSGRALGREVSQTLRRAVPLARARWAQRAPRTVAPEEAPAVSGPDHPSGDPRDVFIAQTVAGRRFVDVGGLWGTVNEKVSVALQAGASTATMLDATPKGGELWERFEEHCRQLGIRNHESISANLDDPGLVDQVGTFEVVHCSGVLYHCPNALLSLTQLFALTEDVLILNSAVVPAELRDRQEWACGPGMAFVPHLSPEQLAPLRAVFEERGVGAVGVTSPAEWDPSDYAPWWWLFMPEAIGEMLRSVGFRVEADAPSWAGMGHTYLARRR
jgi:hypothetical protein